MKNLKTVQGIAKVLKIITLVTSILSFVSIGVLVVGGTLVAILPFGANSWLYELLINVTGTPEPIKEGVSMICEGIFLVGPAIVSVLTYYYFKHQVEDGTPFTHRGADELRTHGILTIVLPLCTEIVASAFAVIVGATDFFAEVGASVEITLGIALILLSFVFKHGAELAEVCSQASEDTKEE